VAGGDALRLLDHHDGVGAGRDHAAGVDEGGRAGVKRKGRSLAHRHFAGEVEKGGQTGRGAVGVGSGDGVAIDGGACKFRQILRRDQLLRQHAIQRVGGGDALAAHRRLEVFDKARPGGGRRVDGEEFSHRSVS
jgi:hypothetical protein